MQFTLTAVTAILASVAVAAPKGWQDSCKPEGTNGSCLTDEKATEIINTYETLISRSITGAEFNETTDALLDAKFFTMSNNINAEVGKELEAISIPSPMAFKAAFSSAPPTGGSATLDLFHACDKIAWRWMGTSPDGLPVRGLTMMNVTPEGKIADTFVEYFRPAYLQCNLTRSAP